MNQRLCDISSSSTQKERPGYTKDMPAPIITEHWTLYSGLWYLSHLHPENCVSYMNVQFHYPLFASKSSDSISDCHQFHYELRQITPESPSLLRPSDICCVLQEGLFPWIPQSHPSSPALFTFLPRRFPPGARPWDSQLEATSQDMETLAQSIWPAHWCLRTTFAKSLSCWFFTLRDVAHQASAHGISKQYGAAIPFSRGTSSQLDIEWLFVGSFFLDT